MKKVLIIVPFEEIYPPMNGGMLRSFNLMNQLSNHFELTAIIQQDKSLFYSAVKDHPALKNCTVISTKDSENYNDIFSLLPLKLRSALRYRFWNRSFAGPAENNFLLVYPSLKKLFEKKVVFDCAILEDLSILNISKTIRKYQPGIKIVYDAFNVNSRLAENELKKGLITKEQYELTKKAECNISGLADYVFTCSDLDLEQLKEMNDGSLKGTVISNGVDIKSENFANDELVNNMRNDILFCGSLNYLPNQEGLAWFIRDVFPLILNKIPSTRLLVIGKGEPNKELAAILNDDSIVCYGMVDRVSDYYKKAIVAIVPLLSGSGTRLKLLEAMGNKVAVVSTSIGAEGIEYTDGNDILIADENSSFANSVIELLHNKTLANSIALNAFTFVKNNYDWNIIGKKMKNYLEMIC